MALIKCSGCGHMVSDKGTKCPKCGTPIHKVEEATKPIEEKEKVIVEVENLKVEIPKVDKPITESPKDDSPISESPKEEVETPIGEYEDEPQRQTWKKVCGFIIFIAIVIGGIYLYVDKQNKAQIEKETMLKAKADSAMVADSLARMAAAEQARQDSIKAVEAIYSAYENKLDENNGLYDECDYFLENLNSDEYPELFIRVGSCEADYRLLIYTYNDGMKKIYDDGAGHSYFCRGNGYVLQVYARMGASSWEKLIFSNNRIETTTIFEEHINEDEDYKNPNEPIIDFYPATNKEPLAEKLKIK